MPGASVICAMPDLIRIGTAGWTIPRQCAEHFPRDGSGLERYAARFTAVEINSTFHRSHKSQTFARWANAVPEGFRFAVKIPKRISHELRLLDTGDSLERFWDEVRNLGPKLGPLLLQLPPSLIYDPATVESFFELLRASIQHTIVCEPRHPTWFDVEADRLLTTYAIARAAADPARVPAAGRPGGDVRFAYYRLHGSPRMYYSAYDCADVAELAAQIRGAAAKEVWCIFDNTASGAATANALAMQTQLVPNAVRKAGP
jgi:uncharacterized protein YecE (DUF72 family)